MGKGGGAKGFYCARAVTIPFIDEERIGRAQWVTGRRSKVLRV
jgi:hypothetical protein